MKRSLNSIKNILQKIWGFIPLTPAGFILLGAGFLLRHYYVFKKQDFLLLVLCTGIFIVLVLSLFQLLLTLMGFFLTYKKQTLGEVAGVTHQEVITNFKIKRLFFTPSIEAQVFWKQPANVFVTLTRKRGYYHESIVAKKRIEAQSITRQVRYRDLLGLVKFYFEFKTPQKIWIRPAAIKSPSPDTLKLFSVGDEFSHPEGAPVGDFVEMRRYTHGDPVKRILWKSYAKTRKLLVRTEEKAISQRKKTYAYLITGNQDEPAAQTAWMALEKDLLGMDFVFATDGTHTPTKNKEEAFKLVVSSSNATVPANNLDEFFNTETDANKSNCLIFASADKKNWVKAIYQLGPHFVKNLQVILSMDQFLIKAKTTSLKKWIVEVNEENQKQTFTTKEIYRDLKKHGVHVIVFDKTAGKVVPGSQLI